MRQKKRITSGKKIQANRENAQLSTGPRSAEGKLAVVASPIKHGLQALSPVIAGMEQQEAWDEHLKRTCEDLAPGSHIEAVLARRIAFNLWRIERVSRYERELIAVQQENAEEEIAQQLRLIYGEKQTASVTNLDDAREDVRDTQRWHKLIRKAMAAADAAPLSGRDCFDIIQETCELLDVETPGDGFRIEGMPADVAWEDHDAWTAALLRSALDEIGKPTGRDATLLLDVLERDADVKAIHAKHNADRLAREVDKYRRLHLLPDENNLSLISRYETNLIRNMQRLMRELEHAQERRRSRPAGPSHGGGADGKPARVGIDRQ